MTRSIRARTPLSLCGLVLLIAAPQAAQCQSPSDEAPRLSAREQKLREERVTVIKKGESSRSARSEALDRLPLDKLTAAQKQRANEVLKSISLFRELPVVSFEVEPDVYRFFVANPEMAVAIWRAMGISKFNMSQTSATEYDADCGDGTAGRVEVLYQTDRQVLLFCEGGFKSPLMARPVRSNCVLSLEWGFYRTQDDKTIVRHRASMFVSFPSQTIETAARVISPISNHIIDHNFREISLFVHMMSVAMQRQPGWVEQLTKKMDGVLDSRKQQFLKLTAQTYVRARKKEAAANGDDEISIDDVLGPVRAASDEQSDGSKLFPRSAGRPAQE